MPDALSLQEAFVDPSDHFRFFGDDVWISFFVLPIAVEVFVLNRRPAFPHGLADAPADILADGFALRLGEGPQQGDEHFPLAIQGVDILLLEDHRDAQFL